MEKHLIHRGTVPPAVFPHREREIFKSVGTAHKLNEAVNTEYCASVCLTVRCTTGIMVFESVCVLNMNIWAYVDWLWEKIFRDSR